MIICLDAHLSSDPIWEKWTVLGNPEIKMGFIIMF